MFRRAILLALVFPAGCEPGVLDPRGSVGLAERQILIDSVFIMLTIVLPTMVAILAFAWWFRAGNKRARFRPDWAYSGQLELMVWAIPLLVILLLGGVTWIGAHRLDPQVALPGGKPALEIQAVSLDWKWLFIYPGQRVASVNALVLPAGVPVHFSLTSGSVMNVFFVPRLGSMIYTMNGMRTQLNLQADAPGDFRGQSSHFSGDGFSDMDFTVHAVPPRQFDAWLSGARAGGPVLDMAGYADLAKQSRHVAPFTYRSADPDLFGRIVTQAVAPAAGPGSDHAG